MAAQEGNAVNTFEQGGKPIMRRRIFRKAIAALGAGLLTAGAVWADPPVTTPEPEVEQYYGIRRIDVPRKVVEAPITQVSATKVETPTTPAAPATPAIPATLPAEFQTMPTTLPGTPNAPTVQMPGVIVFGSLRIANEPGAGGVQQATFVPDNTPRSNVPEVAPKAPETVNHTPAAPVEPAAKAAPAETAMTNRDTPSENIAQVRSQSVDTWMIVGAVFAGTLLTPVILFVMAFGVLRRWMGGNPLIRIEYVGKHGPSVVYGPLAAGSVLAAGGGMAGAPATPVPPEPTTGERFDLGPTFEEELRQRQLNAQHQEDAVLQKLFEDNVRLREQTAALAAETTPVQEAAVNETLPV
jgi:hypothetical protein